MQCIYLTIQDGEFSSTAVKFVCGNKSESVKYHCIDVTLPNKTLRLTAQHIMLNLVQIQNVS